MNHRQTPISRRPGRTADFSNGQRLVLALAGILLLGWVVLGALYVSTVGLPGAALPVLAPSKAPEFAVPLPSTTAHPPNRVTAECALASPYRLEGKTQVSDGGVITIVPAGQSAQAVDLAGIDISGDPAVQEPLVRLLKEFAGGQDAALARMNHPDGPGYLFAAGKFINYELVRQGYASVDAKSEDSACANLLVQAEMAARADQAGIWSARRVPTRTFVPFVTLSPQNGLACDCSIRYECSDFNTRQQAQDCYNACNDYHSRLDLDRNGIACEELP